MGPGYELQTPKPSDYPGRHFVRRELTVWTSSSRVSAHNAAQANPMSQARSCTGIADAPGDKRGALFADWHATMYDAASRLLTHAQAAGTVKFELRADALLAHATGIALTGLPTPRLEMLLDLIRHGYSPADARHK